MLLEFIVRGFDKLPTSWTGKFPSSIPQRRYCASFFRDRNKFRVLPRQEHAKIWAADLNAKNVTQKGGNAIARRKMCAFWLERRPELDNVSIKQLIIQSISS